MDKDHVSTSKDLHIFISLVFVKRGITQKRIKSKHLKATTKQYFDEQCLIFLMGRTTSIHFQSLSKTFYNTFKNAVDHANVQIKICNKTLYFHRNQYTKFKHENHGNYLINTKCGQ